MDETCFLRCKEYTENKIPTDLRTSNGNKVISLIINITIIIICG